MLYVRCCSRSKVDRLRFYLDAKTRPDFSDEVPAEEEELVDCFEYVDVPTDIIRLSPKELLVYFEMFTGQPNHDIAPTLGWFQPKQVLWHESDGGDLDIYYCYRDGKFEFFYSPQALTEEQDEQQYNQNISPQMKQKISELTSITSRSIIITLGRSLETCIESKNISNE